MAYDTRQKTSLSRGYDVVGKMKRDAANKYGGAASGPLTQPVQTEPQQDPAAMRDKLRMQIANEQQQMLAARRAGKTTKGVGADSDALERIANLRGEYGMYSDAARKGQAPNTPEKNFFAGRDAANQAAKIMQNDVAAMEQKVYAMPAGPQRDAEVEKLRAFRSKMNEQFVAGNVMRPEDVGPRVQGDTPDAYGSAMARATQQTASQTASAARDMDRRQNVLKFAQGVTDKRLAGEQYSTDLTAAARQASIAGIRRPEDEFKLKSDQAMAEIDALRKKAAMGDKMAEAQIAKMGAETEAVRYGMNPASPDNRVKDAQASSIISEIERRKRFVEGGQPSTPEEMQQAQAATQFNAERSGATDQVASRAMQAAAELISQRGGVTGDKFVGSMWTGNAEGGMAAVSQIENYVNALNDLYRRDPEIARVKAREFLAGIGEQFSGEGQSFTSELGQAGMVAGGVAAAPFTGGWSLLGTAAGLGLAGGAESNSSQRSRVVARFNDIHKKLGRIAGIAGQ